MRRRLRRTWGTLLSLRSTPHSIALGAAVGIFVGFTPLFGFKTLLTLLGAVLLRASKLAAIAGAALHELVMPLRPALYLLEFELGYWLLHRPHQWALIPRPEQFDLHGGAVWRTFTGVGGPMLLGSVVLAAPVSVLFFVGLRAALSRRQVRIRGEPAGSKDPPCQE